MLRFEKLKKDITYKNIILKNFLNLDEKEREMVRRWRNNSTIREWSYSNCIITIKEHQDFIMKLEKDIRNSYWLVSRKDEYIGVVSLNRIDLKNKNAYLGIYSNPSLKGVGNLLMDCLKGIAFNMARLHTLKLEVIEENKKALKFYKNSGFKKEGKLKDYVSKNGNYKDVIIMGIINQYENKNL